MKKLLPVLFLLISFNIFSQETKELASLKVKEVAFKMYPNPCKSEDQLSLKFEGKVSVKSIEVFDLFGKSIKRIKPNITPDSKFIVGTLPRGIFLLRIQTQKRVATRRIIVQ
ncbi:T9SS type A sorting domain-containing protein [Spongiivirga citrea]|uniref:T9SS type A sorting domain-containing protein n=1 Tax=Spongiivirga citrea TaxID=1481457 RepID=A0A6M0CKL8_9FLAO|nr:T9SS type A sorting domain-containing protein [Spongiivirga citrea]NER18496.1 T9SS type A sorting domain-containing protein [Spongiivirga citrea]